MNVGVLYSGGKDSSYALAKALEKEEVVCLITLVSENTESYMYHTPNIHVTGLQAEAAGIPLLQKKTAGVKEEEVGDLKDAAQEAVQKYGVEGVVSGAIESVYQATRVQKVCDELGLWCFNPLWKKDQVELLDELLEDGYETIVSGVFAYPFDESWLGRRIDAAVVDELIELGEEYGISPSGEGGEIETTVLDAPYYRERINVKSYDTEFRGNSGRYIIEDAELTAK